MIERAGELAALGTAGCWVITALSFESAGKRIGSLSLNLLRLCMALVPLMLWGVVTRGHALPLDIEVDAWGWLGLSALIGFVIGDLCLFRALVLIGPRLSTLVMASVPVWTTLFGLVFLDERLGARELVGIGLTVSGIGWAVLQRQPNKPASAVPVAAPEGPISLRLRFINSGVALALVGALGQAGGLVLSKHGMADHDPFAATQIRVITAIVGFAAVITFAGWWPRVRLAIRDRQAMGATAIGAVFGPFLGVGLSLLAVQLAATGVAASLMATTPILMLPITWLRGERFGWAGALGAMIAVGGVAILLW
ncbi:DMT family transporter [Enhygromyxa salina]|uniref:EamA-like transporter family protein n=1 Tax=Enhygromyxa salina TaxID=215803 RepID=A0A2S9XV37_9BACT|nr:DMT family transporter [Enhygromyxa salina]PRP96736.1 EamA-like transporter family protein [Enhygromyxa salina]